MTDYQVAIIGGGPAGLAAALTLSRSMIKGLLLDAPTPARNAASPNVGAFPARDMTAPGDFRAKVAEEIDGYGFVDRRAAAVTSISRQGENEFALNADDGSAVTADRLLLATGMIDVFPAINGLTERWGQSIVNCPFCQGFEHRDRPWGILVHRPEILDAAEVYLNWTRDLVMFIDPQIAMSDDRRLQLERLGVRFFFGTVGSLEGVDGYLSKVVMTDGVAVDREILLVWPWQTQCALVTSLGPALTEGGYVRIDEGYRTDLPGVYAAGDLVYGGHQNTNTAIHMGNMAAATIVFDICQGG